MLKKSRNFTYQHTIPTVFILAVVFFWLVIGVSTLFSYLPNNLFVKDVDAIISMQNKKKNKNRIM